MKSRKDHHCFARRSQYEGRESESLKNKNFENARPENGNPVNEGPESKSPESVQTALATELKRYFLYLLGRREYSRAALAAKAKARCSKSSLSRHEIERVITSVLEQLVDDGWLSDSRFTESYIRTQAQKGYGPLRIRQELVSKGINRELISTVEEKLDIDWDEQLDRRMQEKCKNLQQGKILDYKEKARIARYFQYRGYAAGDILARLES